MYLIKTCILGVVVLSALAFSKCERYVKIAVNPAEVSGSGLIDVTWKTKNHETTTISSNPALPGLPKTLTGSGSATDKFPVTVTTTFQIKGQTGQQVQIKSATVTVGRGGPIGISTPRSTP